MDHQATMDHLRVHHQLAISDVPHPVPPPADGHEKWFVENVFSLKLFKVFCVNIFGQPLKYQVNPMPHLRAPGSSNFCTPDSLASCATALAWAMASWAFSSCTSLVICSTAAWDTVVVVRTLLKDCL